MPMILGLFESSEQAARALQQANLGPDANARVAGQRLTGLEHYATEKAYKHERTVQSDAVLVAIESETADLVALRSRLEAAGMEALETQYNNPRAYSQYPYGDGVDPATEEHPPKMTRAGKTGSDSTASQAARQHK